VAIELVERAPDSDDWIFKILRSRAQWELERYQEDKSIEELNRAIEQYVTLGFSIVPLLNGGKLSPQKWGEYQKRQASIEEIWDWSIKYGIFNIGIVTGRISKLVVIDCDSAEQREILKVYIPELNQTSVCKTSRGFHYYFRSNGERIGTQRILIDKVAGGIELKAEGSYVVAPPSTVEGVKREWLVGLEHLQVIPESLIKLLKIRQEHKQEQTQTAVWRFKGEASCISQILQRELRAGENGQRGERDIALFILYNLLVRNGNSPEYAKRIVEKKNAMLREPLKEKELAWVFAGDYNGLGCSYVTSNLGWIDCEGCKFKKRGEISMVELIEKARRQGLIDTSKINFDVYAYVVLKGLEEQLDELRVTEQVVKEIGVSKQTIYNTLNELKKATRLKSKSD
jgi:hypothetical protein